MKSVTPVLFTFAAAGAVVTFGMTLTTSTGWTDSFRTSRLATQLALPMWGMPAAGVTLVFFLLAMAAWVRTSPDQLAPSATNLPFNARIYSVIGRWVMRAGFAIGVLGSALKIMPLAVTGPNGSPLEAGVQAVMILTLALGPLILGSAVVLIGALIARSSV